jgi:hypothetical protein
MGFELKGCRCSVEAFGRLGDGNAQDGERHADVFLSPSGALLFVVAFPNRSFALDLSQPFSGYLQTHFTPEDGPSLPESSTTLCRLTMGFPGYSSTVDFWSDSMASTSPVSKNLGTFELLL